MDAWLKAAVKAGTDLQQTLEKRAGELQDRAFEADDPKRRDFEFDTGPLGFTLDGTLVTSVEPKEQAARLGVCVGHVLVAVDGYDLPPDPAPGDDAGKTKQRKQIKAWIKNMPRPGLLAFTLADDRQPLQRQGAAPVEEAEEVSEEAIAEREAEEARVMALMEGAPDATDAGATAALGAGAGEPGAAAVQEWSAGHMEAAARPGDATGAAAEDWDPSDDAQVRRLKAELQMARDQQAHMERELDTFRAECERLRQATLASEEEAFHAVQARLESQVRGLQEQLAAARTEEEASQRSATDLQRQLAAAVEKCEELQRLAEQDEEMARESFESREHTLEAELNRIRSALSAQESEAKAATDAAARRADDAEARIVDLQSELAKHRVEKDTWSGEASAAVNRAEQAEQQAHRLALEHWDALEAMRISHEQALRVMQSRAEEAERQRDAAQQALGGSAPKRAYAPDEDSDDDADEAQGPVVPEAGADAFAFLSTPNGADGAFDAPAELASPAGAVTADDAEQMRQHIASLEQRCVALQKKLRARPIVYKGKQSLAAALRTPFWDPYLRAAAGPVVADGALKLYGMPERFLRRFTERLLSNNLWFWLFYAHLLFLYTLAASSYGQATMGSTATTMATDPVDSINLKLEQAAPAAKQLRPA